MTGKRKRYSAEFKSKVALEATYGELTTAQLKAIPQPADFSGKSADALSTPRCKPAAEKP